MKHQLHRSLPFLMVATSAVSLTAAPVLSVLFEGDYGANRNSALGRATEFHFEDRGDFNNDGSTDARRFIPLLFPYPGIGTSLGPVGLDFQIDQDLFGKSGKFYTGGQIVAYSAPAGFFPRFGLYRWGAGPQAIQLTSGLLDDGPTSDMGFLATMFAIKQDFLNGAALIEDLKLPNMEDGFSAEVFFRGLAKSEADPAGVRRARFLIQAGAEWYISQSGTAGEDTPRSRDMVRTLSINPAADYWYPYDVTTMLFIYESGEPALPAGTPVRGDTLSDIQAVGVIMQNTRFDGTVENHYVWLNWNEFSFHLDPDPEPLGDDPWQDTGDWLGMMYTVHAPWIYSTLLEKWLFLPEHANDESGAWLFVPAP